MATIHGNFLSNKGGFVFGLHGTEDRDFIYGHEGDDELYGYGGDDRLDGGTGADTMYGGDGNDTYIVDNYNDQVIENHLTNGNPGNDTVVASVRYALSDGIENLRLTGSADVGEGNASDNVITGTSNDNWLYGYGGDDELRGDEGNDVLDGGTGEDTLYGGQDQDRLYGNDHDDTLYGESGNDRLYGGDGLDDLFGGTGDDTLYGENGRDELNGSTGADTMYGGADSDEYTVDNVGDVVVELAGEGHLDTVRSAVSYTLTANVERLTLVGTAANGTGNSLDNYITGNAENNRLNGGFGDDILRGEGGRDSFVFDTLLIRGNIDIVADFEPADDTILLDNAVFTALPAVDIATLSPTQFRVGSAAMDSSDRIIYNRSTGALLYDPDGTGAQAARHFADIGAGMNVTDQDFLII